MACNCKKKVKELSKYSDEGADRKFEVGFLGKIWRILTGTVITVVLIAVGICIAPIGIAVAVIRTMLGKKTNINLKRFLKNGRQV